MEINHVTKYEVGRTLYYLTNGRIKEAHIIGVRCSFKEGDYYDNSKLFEEFYVIEEANRCRSTLSANDVPNNYFLSKKDILKYIADQI